jgi:hypothetical protein
MNKEPRIWKIFVKTFERIEALFFVKPVTGLGRSNTGKDDNCEDEFLMIWNEVNVRYSLDTCK